MTDFHILLDQVAINLVTTTDNSGFCAKAPLHFRLKKIKKQLNYQNDKLYNYNEL